MNKPFNNKKAIFTPITLFFIFIIFDLIWVLALAPIITTWTWAAVDAGTITGVEAFLYTNINLIIFLFQIIAIIAVATVGGE